MTQTVVRNHDHLDWNTVRQCEAVQNLSRFTPANNGDFEPPENMLLRVNEVAEGMKVIVQQVCRMPKEDK